MKTATQFQNFDDWAKAIFAKYPQAKLHQEKIKTGGFCKVAFVGRQLVGKYTITANNGWID